MNPPVEAPISIATLPLTSASMSLRNPSNLYPPLLTYFSCSVIDMTELLFVSALVCVIVWPSVLTIPLAIANCAFSIFSKKPPSTNNWSKRVRFLIFLNTILC